MAGDLVLYEKTLTAMEPRFAAVLSGSGVPVAQAIQCALYSIEKSYKIQQCNMPSIVNSMMTSCVLGLLVDGVTGQGFFIPYAGDCTFQIGYKGYPTIGDRSGYTCNMGVIRDGDDWDYSEGSNPFVRVKRMLGNESGRRIIASWATAEKLGRAPIVAVQSIDQINETKAKSQGAKKAESPWNDPGRGFAAMAAKTALRQVGKLIPVVTMQRAAEIDRLVDDEGRPAYLTEQGMLIDGKTGQPVEHVPPTQIDMKREFVITMRDGATYSFKNAQEWIGWHRMNLPKIKSLELLHGFVDRNKEANASYMAIDSDAVMAVENLIADRRKTLTAGSGQ